MIGALALAGCEGAAGVGDRRCTLGARIDAPTAIRELRGAAAMPGEVALWYTPPDGPVRVLLASHDGRSEEAGEIAAVEIFPTGPPQRVALIARTYEGSDTNIFYLPIGPGGLGEPIRLTDTASATYVHAALWTGSETLLVIHDSRAALFPDSGRTGTVAALLRLDLDGNASQPVELEDAPPFITQRALYTRIGSTVVSISRDLSTFTLLQHDVTGGAPLATTTFDIGLHDRFWFFDGDDEATLAILRGDALELTPIGADLARGTSRTIALDARIGDMRDIQLARQAGGWTLAYSTPVVDDGGAWRGTIIARHFDAALAPVGVLESMCAGTVSNSSPVAIELPPGTDEPTVIWHYPRAAWLGLSTF